MTRGRLVVLVTAAALVVLDVAGPHGHGAWWHSLPAFDLIYGAAGCVVIVLVSKFLGSAWLQRPESYYKRDL